MNCPWGNITRSSVTCRVSLSRIYRVLCNSFSYPRYARITTHSNNARTFSCKCSDTRCNLNGAARVKNYPHQRSPEVRIKAFRKTSVKVFGEKRGPSEVCRYIFYKAQYRAFTEPQKLQLCFSLKKRLMRRALCSFLSAQKGD